MNARKKVDRGNNVVDIEGERWLRVHPDMGAWAESHVDMIEWMTEETSKNQAPRSDCG
jgi:hypothetical protein